MKNKMQVFIFVYVAFGSCIMTRNLINESRLTNLVSVTISIGQHEIAGFKELYDVLGDA